MTIILYIITIYIFITIVCVRMGLIYHWILNATSDCSPDASSLMTTVNTSQNTCSKSFF